MDQLLAQWPALLIALAVAGPLAKVIQALYERIITELKEIIADLKAQNERLADAFDNLADALEPFVDPDHGPRLRRKDGAR